MNKLIVAFVAGFMSLAMAGAHAADKADAKKSETGMAKSEKGAAKSADATSKNDDKKKKADVKK